MKYLILTFSVLFFAQSAMALPFNPSRTKAGISLVVLESEINDVLRELTTKSVIGLTLAPTRINWNEMIDMGIAVLQARPGGCSAECHALSQLKLPVSPNIYVPLYIKIKSAQFEFRSDGRIFLDATIGVNVTTEVASFSIRLETSPQLVAASPLTLTTSAMGTRTVGTAAFQTAALKLCTDKLATQAKLTSFSLSYSNSLLRGLVMEKVQEMLDGAIADVGGNCYTLTEGLLPPRSAYAKGQRMEFPTIVVSQDVLELRTKLIVPRDVQPAINFLLLE